MRDKLFILHLDKGIIKDKTLIPIQFLINQSSKLFLILFQSYFNRKCDHFIYIHLSRLGIALEH